MTNSYKREYRRNSANNVQSISKDDSHNSPTRLKSGEMKMSTKNRSQNSRPRWKLAELNPKSSRHFSTSANFAVDDERRASDSYIEFEEEVKLDKGKRRATEQEIDKDLEEKYAKDKLAKAEQADADYRVMRGDQSNANTGSNIEGSATNTATNNSPSAASANNPASAYIGSSRRGGSGSGTNAAPSGFGGMGPSDSGSAYASGSSGNSRGTKRPNPWSDAREGSSREGGPGFGTNVAPSDFGPSDSAYGTNVAPSGMGPSGSASGSATGGQASGSSSRRTWAGSEGKHYLPWREERPSDYSPFVKVRTDTKSWTLHEKITMEMKRKIVREDFETLRTLKWHPSTNQGVYDLFHNRYHVGNIANPAEYMRNYLKNTHLEDIQIFHNPFDEWTTIAIQERFNCSRFYIDARAFNLTTIFRDPTSHPSNTTSGLRLYTVQELPAFTHTARVPNYQTAVLPRVNSTTSGPSNTTGLNDTISLSNITWPTSTTSGPSNTTVPNDTISLSNITWPTSTTSGPNHSTGLNLPAPSDTINTSGTTGPSNNTAVLPSVNSTTSNIAGTTSGPSDSSRPNDPMAISSITNPSNSQKVSLLNDNKPLSSTSNPLKDSFSGGLGYKEDYIEKFLELVTKFMEKIIKYFF